MVEPWPPETIPKAAKALNVSPSAMYDWTAQGVVPVITLGGRRLIPGWWLREQLMKGAPPEVTATIVKTTEKDRAIQAKAERYDALVEKLRKVLAEHIES
jgi:hypothetical protein